jgi:transposase
VVDHDTGLLIWAAPGREASTVHAFFDQLGAERCRLLTHLSADGADWIAGPAAARAPQAILCADPFHVVSWATGALDEVRREVWRTARHAGAITAVRHGSRTIRVSSGDARDLKHARYALWKNPGNLTGRQAAKLAWIEKTHPRLWRAYLLKEGLRVVFQLKGEEGKYALARWLSWAARCRITEFTELGKVAQPGAGVRCALAQNIVTRIPSGVMTSIWCGRSGGSGRPGAAAAGRKWQVIWPGYRSRTCPLVRARWLLLVMRQLASMNSSHEDGRLAIRHWH